MRAAIFLVLKDRDFIVFLKFKNFACLLFLWVWVNVWQLNSLGISYTQKKKLYILYVLICVTFFCWLLLLQSSTICVNSTVKPKQAQMCFRLYVKFYRIKKIFMRHSQYPCFTVCIQTFNSIHSGHSLISLFFCCHGINWFPSQLLNCFWGFFCLNLLSLICVWFCIKVRERGGVAVQKRGVKCEIMNIYDAQIFMQFPN